MIAHVGRRQIRQGSTDTGPQQHDSLVEVSRVAVVEQLLVPKSQTVSAVKSVSLDW